MINSNDIKKDMLELLEAEETLDVTAPQYYDDPELLSAINLAVLWVVNVVNASLSKKKITEEIFSEMSQTYVFRTSSLSRISLNTFPSKPWTIRAVHPIIETVVSAGTPVDTTDVSKSYFRSDLVMSKIKKTADRLSIEEWAMADLNPFKGGFNTTCSTLREYAYLNPETYTQETVQDKEIEIKPIIPATDVAISFVPLPERITEFGSNDIALQHQVYSLLVNKALNFISYKQGDAQKTLYDVTSQDIATLAQLILK